MCCSVWQSVAVCCGVSQCVKPINMSNLMYRVKVIASVCCSLLQCVAVCCSVLQCVAVCRGVSQCVKPINMLNLTCLVRATASVYCSVVQRVAACCSVLQRVAVRGAHHLIKHDIQPMPDRMALNLGIISKTLSTYQNSAHGKYD